MFSKFFKSVLLMLTLVSTLLISSCQKEETASVSEEDALKSAQIDAANDEVDAIIEETYVNQEGLLSGKSTTDLNPFPACMTRTVVRDGMFRTVTLDFGIGCEMPNGNVLSGKIVMVYEINPIALSQTITFTYDGFTFNGIALSGGGSIVRILANTEGNPQSTATVDVTATFPDNSSAHRTGTKVREWIVGFNNSDWTDNMFKVTGNWKTEFSNGDVNTGLVTTPLIRKATCPFFVSGVVQLTHNGAVSTLDYGDGTCDNVAILTGPDGVQHTIKLGK